MRLFHKNVTHLIDKNAYLDIVSEWETKNHKWILEFFDVNIDNLP